MRALVILAALLAAGPARAEPLTFEGRVEAFARAEVSSQLDGVVAEVLFRGGERVEVGQVLIRMDPHDADLGVAEAEAALARAEADLIQAREEAERQVALGARGIAPTARVQAARRALSAAEADHTIAQVALRRARLDKARVTIEAGITGIVSRPRIAVGTFIEAESGAPLAEIVRMDPALIAYQVPYAARLAALAASGASNLEALFQRVRLTVLMPDGSAYGHTARPDFASASVDPETGALTVWAWVANPDALLRPGLAVTVVSDILPQPKEGGATQ